MLIRLPLPYIRPLGSKCFAGGYSTLAVRAGSYWNRNHGRPPASTPSTEVRLIPSDILCSKQAKRKNSNPASSGSSLTTDPFDWTRGQSNSQPQSAFIAQTVRVGCLCLMIYSVSRSICFGRTARGEVAEWLNAAVC
jgi:hypothetical protein